MSETLPETQMLQEIVDSGSHKLRVDRKSHLIRGVKLLGLRSRNGRRYQESALAEAVSLYEGAKVNVNHPKGHPLSPRDYQDRLGVICGVIFRPGEGLFGDLQFNPKHALSEQLTWDAEHAPQNVGLSHNVLARTAREGSETVVEAITQVQSIDLVADPATTRGLFEHAQRAAFDHAENGDSLVSWEALTLEQLELHRPDLAGQWLQAQTAELAECRRQLDQAAAREAVIARRQRIVELLAEHMLPPPWSTEHAAGGIVSDTFIGALLQAPDDASLEQLVEERAALVRSVERWHAAQERTTSNPMSRDQTAVALDARCCTTSSKEFAAAICGR